MMDFRKELTDFIPAHDFFIGIDSDGCVFDSMEVKQKEFFIPGALKYFDLFPVSKYVRETWEFVNLYSAHRGVNRFPAMIKVFELLSQRNEVTESGCALPDLKSLKEWISVETRLSNSSLRSYCEKIRDPSLNRILLWSENINREIAEWLHNIPPFPNSVKAIEHISQFADSIVVSQTPLEALDREWHEHDLKKYITIIAGQEYGTKSEHIALAAKGKYPDSRILMIGDAYGDMHAAKDNGVLFFPVIPGKEAESWKNLLNEGLERFRNGTFAGVYEESLLKDFTGSLPVKAPWQV